MEMKYGRRAVEDTARTMGIEYQQVVEILERYGHKVVESSPGKFNGECNGETNPGVCVQCGVDVDVCWIKPLPTWKKLHCTRVMCIVAATRQGGGYDPRTNGGHQQPQYCASHIPDHPPYVHIGV